MAALSGLTGVDAGSGFRKKESEEYAMYGPPELLVVVPVVAEPFVVAGAAAVVPVLDDEAAVLDDEPAVLDEVVVLDPFVTEGAGAVVDVVGAVVRWFRARREALRSSSS